MSFTQTFIYLLAAVVSVPLAKRLGLGSVLGYLLAGVAIGRFGLGFVGHDGELMHVAEFGVVMMLFLIGLELRPAMLWQMRAPILGLGGAQVVGTTAAVALTARLLGLSWQVAITVGFIIAMSSTAIVLQLLNEKGIMRTSGGRASFAVLLFQDIAVIPILAVLPLLATLAPVASSHASQQSAIDHLPAWQAAVVVLAAVAAVIVGGRFLLRPVFRYIAATDLREMFTATALLLVVGIALLMQKVGLSPALGAFLAGVVLAESEYRHQLETDIEPFKGLLLGLFFIAVGAGIDFTLIAARPGTVGGIVIGVLVVKFAVLLAVSRYSRLEPTQRYLFAFALAQGGEFAFVLCSYAVQNGVIPPDLSNLLIASVALTMAAAPILFTINHRLVQPQFASVLPEREPDEIDERENPVIVAGVGRFGHIVARLLRLNGYGTTVLDHDAEQVETLGRFGIKSYYGDATRLDLLRTAGAERAKLFVIAIDQEEQALRIVDLVHANFPKLRILARATSRQHAYELLRRGVNDVYRETFGSAVDLSVDALQALGMPQQRAIRAAQIFREHDNASVREMADVDENDMKGYVSMARIHIANLEGALAADRELETEAEAALTETDEQGKAAAS